MGKIIELGKVLPDVYVRALASFKKRYNIQEEDHKFDAAFLEGWYASLEAFEEQLNRIAGEKDDG